MRCWGHCQVGLLHHSSLTEMMVSVSSSWRWFDLPVWNLRNNVSSLNRVERWECKSRKAGRLWGVPGGVESSGVTSRKCEWVRDLLMSCPMSKRRLRQHGNFEKVLQYRTSTCVCVFVCIMGIGWRVTHSVQTLRQCSSIQYTEYHVCVTKGSWEEREQLPPPI